jgi:hypothetical protein
MPAAATGWGTPVRNTGLSSESQLVYDSLSLDKQAQIDALPTLEQREQYLKTFKKMKEVRAEEKRLTAEKEQSGPAPTTVSNVLEVETPVVKKSNDSDSKEENNSSDSSNNSNNSSSSNENKKVISIS